MRGFREQQETSPRQEYAGCEKTILARGMTREPAPWSWTGAGRLGSRANDRKVELKSQSWVVGTARQDDYLGYWKRSPRTRRDGRKTGEGGAKSGEMLGGKEEVEKGQDISLATLYIRPSNFKIAEQERIVPMAFLRLAGTRNKWGKPPYCPSSELFRAGAKVPKLEKA
ncbi:hypothetical protein C8R44DRAFT_739390 [Mycena epipterygia]|nr:hypothetical protein C8R44DRAFT_739390 [Mycena epipterygia]